MPLGDRYRAIEFSGLDPRRLAARPARVVVRCARPGERSHAPPCPALVEAVLDEAGLPVGKYRSAPLARRERPCLRALRAATPEIALERFRAEPRLLAPALSTIMIGVTRFFRDPPVFEQLAAQVLPRLGAANPHLEIVSLGCSEGQELYSVAMLLDELGVLQGCRLLGIDVRADAIAAAQAGRYPAAAFEDVPQRWRRCVIADGNRISMAPRLRAHTRWQAGSIFGLPPGPPWDLVLFRNLVMYLEPAAAESVWRAIAARLRRGGVLVVGKAERPPGNLGLRRIGFCTYANGGLE